MLRKLSPLLMLLFVAGFVIGVSYSGALGGERYPERPSLETEPTIVIDLAGGAGAAEHDADGSAGAEGVDGGPADGGSGSTERKTPDAEASTGTQGGESSSSALPQTPETSAGTALQDGTGAAASRASEPGSGGASAESAGGGAAGTGGDSAQTHVVEEGETLWSIAQAHGATVEELMEANGIEDPATLQIGRELRIP